LHSSRSLAEERETYYSDPANSGLINYAAFPIQCFLLQNIAIKIVHEDVVQCKYVTECGHTWSTSRMASRVLPDRAIWRVPWHRGPPCLLSRGALRTMLQLSASSPSIRSSERLAGGVTLQKRSESCHNLTCFSESFPC
jgi:hypothetical protein